MELGPGAIGKRTRKSFLVEVAPTFALLPRSQPRPAIVCPFLITSAGLDLVFPNIADRCHNNNNGDPRPRRIDLVHALVKHQVTAYMRLSLDGPCWDHRMMSLKEIEHALCEFGKHQKLKKGGRRRIVGRIWNSRSHLDLDKPCAMCEMALDDGVFCANVRTILVSWVCLLRSLHGIGRRCRRHGRPILELRPLSKPAPPRVGRRMKDSLSLSLCWSTRYECGYVGNTSL